MKYDETLFAKNITWLINNKKISVKTLCNLIGKDRTLIQRWKNGDRQPIVRDVYLICDFLNISMDDLITKDLSKTKDIKPFNQK